MTATRPLPCDTLSNSTRTDSPQQLYIMDIMGAWKAPGCRWVYFAERDGLVKIGYSANVDQRMRQLGTRLLAVMPGGNGMERRMHGLFGEYRVHGEWFHPGLGLVGFIEALHGDDPYFKVDLPDDYRNAECERLTSIRRAEIEDDRTDREDRARQRLPMSSHPGFAEADRRAADLIGAVLSGRLASLAVAS